MPAMPIPEWASFRNLSSSVIDQGVGAIFNPSQDRLSGRHLSCPRTAAIKPLLKLRARHDGSVSGVFEVVAAFAGLDGCDEAADMAYASDERRLVGRDVFGEACDLKSSFKVIRRCVSRFWAGWSGGGAGRRMTRLRSSRRRWRRARR